MKQLQKISLVFLMIVSSFSACKKEEKLWQIQGSWWGKYYEESNQAVTNEIKITIKADNTINMYVKSQLTGTWTLNGSSFISTANGYYFNATFDNKTGKLVNGTWGEVGGPSEGGWSAVKQ